MQYRIHTLKSTFIGDDLTSRVTEDKLIIIICSVMDEQLYDLTS